MRTLYIALLCLLSATCCAAGTDMPQSLALIADELGMEIPIGKEFHCPRVHGNPLLYSTEEEGTLTQVGVRLFSQETRDNTVPQVCDCIERLWLELLLADGIEAQNKLLKTRNVRMTVDGFPLGSKHFQSIDVALDIIKASTQTHLKAEAEDIIMDFRTFSATNLRIILPADRSVIFPFDKKEHEEFLYKILSGYTGVFSPQRMEIPSSMTQENGYWVSGGQYYMIDSLSNNVYYRKDKGKTAVVCDPSDPVTSLRNMAMGAVPQELLSGIVLEIRFKAYNQNLRNLKVTLSHFLSCMEGQGLAVYSGKLSSSKSDKVLLVFHHPLFKYINMLTINIPKGSAFPSPCILPAEFTAFIPQSNINNLFENNNPEK